MGYARIVLALVALVISSWSDHHTAKEQQKQQLVLALILWAVSSSLDLFDGIVARRWNQTSRVGALLDVVADNLWRSTVWLAAALRGYTRRSTTSTVQLLPPVLVALGAVLIPTVEWMTTVAHQLEAASTQTHWKDRRPDKEKEESKPLQPPPPRSKEELEDPVWVQAFFAHGFKNPRGMLGIYGLFACPFLLLSGCLNEQDSTGEGMPLYHIWLMLLGLALIGRFLVALPVELWFCYKLLHRLLLQDENDRKLD